MTTAVRSFVLCCILAALTVPAAAATPPDQLNYQGVLRDAAGDPIDGSFDMVFRLFDVETLGTELILDRHLAANGQAVQVAGGLFSVGLGTGEVLDGWGGPGNYTTLTQVFAEFDALWLEIEVGGETLAPRLRVQATPYALNAANLDGKPSTEFLDTSSTPQGKDGRLRINPTAFPDQGRQLEVYGTTSAAYFRDVSYGGSATVGAGSWGIRAHGDAAGGYFSDSNGTGEASVGVGNSGIEGSGTSYGGYFEDSDSSGYAYLGYGHYGMEGYGTTAGGYFKDSDNQSHAYVGYSNYGIAAYGASHGGYFADFDNSGYARAGYGDYGIQGYGNQMGALFDDTNGSGFAYLAFGEWGAYGYGNSGGFTGSDLNNGTVGYLATSTSSTQGNGSKNFVQNHPYRDDQVILYAAPEGNEVATYTRGTARLVKGEARIALDETFAWVTNPDVGLTAHLTPRSAGALLHTAELGTGELVVRGTPDDAVFDYMVWGLRIGFEEVNVVEPKGDRDAWIPSMQEHRASQQADPALRKHVALERFKAMNAAVGKSADVDLSRATALRDAIGVFDPAVDRVGQRPEDLEPTAAATREHEPIAAPERFDEPAGVASREPVAELVRDETPREPLAEPVVAGELIVMDETGALKRALGEADPGVVGVAAEDSLTLDGVPQAALVFSGIAMLKVDADLGAIARGDLLISSPTPGHAMRAYAPIAGTVVAKALEPLEAGQRTIRVVVTLR